MSETIRRVGIVDIKNFAMVRVCENKSHFTSKFGFINSKVLRHCINEFTRMFFAELIKGISNRGDAYAVLFGQWLKRGLDGSDGEVLSQIESDFISGATAFKLFPKTITAMLAYDPTGVEFKNNDFAIWGLKRR